MPNPEGHPSTILTTGPRPRRSPRHEESPARDLLRLRWREQNYKLNPTQDNEDSIERWAFVVNTKWRTHYAKLYEQEQMGL